MADWSILKSSNNDFLSSLTTYSNHDAALTKFQMMSSFIDGTYTPPTQIYDDSTFCKPENIDECLTHLNQEVTGLGLQPVSRDGVGCTTSLINRLEEIIRMYQRSNRIKEDLENRVHRMSCDASDNQSVIRRLKNDKERLERSVAQEKELHRQTHNKVKNLNTKFKSEKDELKRVQSIIKDRDAQYKHELKKKQREVNRLMEKLHQLLMDKNPDRRIGMDMEGYLRRGDSKRSTWKNTASSNKQEEMYQLLMSNYEEKHQELRVENSDLRDCLIDMQRELTTVLNTSNSNITSLHAHNGDLSSSSSEEDFSTSSSVSHDLTDDYFQMPYEMLRENLQKNFQDTCKRLRQSFKKCSNNSSTPSTSKSLVRQSSPSKSPSHNVDENRDNERRHEEMEKLRKQIDKYKEIVKQQEELIQKSLSTQSRSMENTFLQESQILQEKESLSEQRRKFYQEKANFEEERRQNAETSRQIQHERKQLEEERANMLRNQIINMSPYNSSKPPTPQKSKEKTRLLPSTPVFSPAPGKPNSALTTSAELLKLLSLSKKKSPQKSPDKQSIMKSGSADSLSSSCMSAKSAPCDLIQNSSRSSKRSFEKEERNSDPSRRLVDTEEINSSSSRRLSYEELEDLQRCLLSQHRRRSSSLSSLDGQ